VAGQLISNSWRLCRTGDRGALEEAHRHQRARTTVASRLRARVRFWSRGRSFLRRGSYHCTLRRFLFVLEYFPPHIGGVEMLFGELAAELVRRGHAVEVITLAEPGQPGHERATE